MSFSLRLLSIALLTACLGLNVSYGQQDFAPNSPVSYFKFPRFDPISGYVTWDLQGTTGRYLDATHIFVEELVLRSFSGDEQILLESTLTSETATINVAQETAVGEGQLHIESDSFEIKGTGWSWDGANKTISVHQDVEVFLPQGFINILD